jgi:hypothetical protein
MYLFGEALTIEREEPERKRRDSPPTLTHKGEDFNLTREAVTIFDELVRRRTPVERDLILEEAVRRLKAWRAQFGKKLWFCGVEISSSELYLEERGLVSIQRLPVLAAIVGAQNVAGGQESEEGVVGRAARETPTARIKSMKPVRCPNPDCDEEEGCCVCEHTGWIREFVMEEMQVPS